MRYNQSLIEYQVLQAVRLGHLPQKTEVRISRTYSKKGCRYFLDIPTETFTKEEFVGMGPKAAAKTIYEMTGIKPPAFL